MGFFDKMMSSELDAGTVQQDGSARLALTAKIVSLLGIGLSLFHIWACIFGLFDFITQRGIHMAFAMTMIALQMPMVNHVAKGKFIKSKLATKIFLSLDILLIVAMWVGVFISKWEYKNRIAAAGSTSMIAVIAGFLMLIVVLEVSRRQLGLILPSMAVISVLYAWAGPYLPEIVMHRGYTWKRIFGFLAANPDGLFGTTMDVSSTVIFMFIMFGAFLEASGANDFINSSAMALTGRTKSGPAMAAVLASASMGTINGSAVANVVGTGTFTIPLMKKSGFKPEFAGAVEAVASTGGQVLPPVMGAGAFIMVVFTEVSYAKIIVAAAIPAILYFLAVAAALVFRAERAGLKGLSADQLPKLGESLRKGIPYIPPLTVLLYSLLISANSPMMAAFYGAVAIPVAMAFTKDRRFNFKKILQALEGASKNALTVIAGCACAGIIVAMVAITGLGVVFSDMMLSLSGGNLFLALLFTAMACIILGMGLPTTAAYVIAAAIVAPALTNLGLPILTAHLFIFYFACLSAITPPVALAAYAGAGIAKADPMKTGVEACKLGFAGFVVPFMFAYNDLLLFHGPLLEIAWAAVTALIGVIVMSAGFQGWFLKRASWVERVLLLGAGLGMVKPGFYTDMVGLSVVAVVIIYELATKKKTQLKAEA